MICQDLNFHSTHEEEHGISSVFELIKLGQLG